MALYIPQGIFHLARLLYVRPETFGPYYVPSVNTLSISITLMTLGTKVLLFVAITAR